MPSISTTIREANSMIDHGACQQGFCLLHRICDFAKVILMIGRPLVLIVDTLETISAASAWRRPELATMAFRHFSAMADVVLPDSHTLRRILNQLALLGTNLTREVRDICYNYAADTLADAIGSCNPTSLEDYEHHCRAIDSLPKKNEGEFCLRELLGQDVESSIETRPACILLYAKQLVEDATLEPASKAHLEDSREREVSEEKDSGGRDGERKDSKE